LQKAQRDQKRAIDNYNREVRRYNSAVKKAVNDYNREVQNYNSNARVHNREVENQRRRLQQEIARLNSRSSSTPFVTYRASTRAFVEIYDRAEAGLASSPSSAADRRLLNLVSDEAANSVYLANALDGDGDPAGSFTEDELRAPSMQTELAHFGEDLVNRWVGALYALSPQNPDAARHFCTSAREVVITMLDTSAPDAGGEAEGPRLPANRLGRSLSSLEDRLPTSSTRRNSGAGHGGSCWRRRQPPLTLPHVQRRHPWARWALQRPGTLGDQDPSRVSDPLHSRGCVGAGALRVRLTVPLMRG
jgi:hypothetical protein